MFGKLRVLRIPSLRAPLDILFLVCCIALTFDVLGPEIWGSGKTKDYPLWFWAGQQVLQGGEFYPGSPSDYFDFIYPPISAVLLAIPAWFGKLPLYAKPDVVHFLRNTFSYIFDGHYRYGGLPQVELREIAGPVDIFRASFEPIPVMHGEMEILGFRFGSAAYLTDHSEVPAASKAKLQNLDILFVDALRHTPHPTHSTVEKSLRLIEELKPRRAFFTHICHDLSHVETEATLPANVRLAHDGLKLEFEI